MRFFCSYINRSGCTCLRRPAYFKKDLLGTCSGYVFYCPDHKKQNDCVQITSKMFDDIFSTIITDMSLQSILQYKKALALKEEENYVK